MDTLHDAIDVAMKSHEYLTLPLKISKLLPYKIETFLDIEIDGVLVEFEHTDLNQYVILVLEN